MPTATIICSYCRTVLGTKPSDHDIVSHTICPNCIRSIPEIAELYPELKKETGKEKSKK